jgi:hypothetical protein
MELMTVRLIHDAMAAADSVEGWFVAMGKRYKASIWVAVRALLRR